MNYHAHVYFDEKTNQENLHLFELHLSNAKALNIGIYPRVPRPVGPHPLPMFEVHFTDQEKTNYLMFLNKNIGNLSVLIHQETGDDVPDHSTGAEWLGKKLELNFDFFEFIKKHPSRKIHP